MERMVHLKVYININIAFNSIETCVQITSGTLDDQIFCAMYFSMLLCNICTFLYHLDVTLWNGVVLEQIKQNLAVLSDICCSNYTQRKRNFAVCIVDGEQKFGFRQNYIITEACLCPEN